jgi:hypothetical protein
LPGEVLMEAGFGVTPHQVRFCPGVRLQTQVQGAWSGLDDLGAA